MKLHIMADKKTSKPARHWCYTLNNYTPEELDRVRTTVCRYQIFGLEVGDEGTPHLQGYIEFAGPMRMKATKTSLGSDRFHLEQRAGSRDEARNYCLKDGIFEEFGNWNLGGAGARTDIYGLMDKLKEGMPLLEIIEDDAHLYARNLKFADRYTALLEVESTRPFRTVTVSVFHGPAGTGKTSKVMDLTERKVFTVNVDDSFPFDGYDGESSILIDDFYGGLKYGYFLRVLDGHQLRINVKGGHRYAKWTNVYITSNKPPADWYKVGLTPALSRRLTTVVHLTPDVLDNTGDQAFYDEINIHHDESWSALQGHRYEVPGNTVNSANLEPALVDNLVDEDFTGVYIDM